MLVLERVESAEATNSEWWCEHFLRNESRQIEIPWDEVAALNDDQRKLLFPSLQDFQLGESSEGRHGQARAKAYAERIGDAHYADAIRLFFAEENRHAGYLARYLRKHDVALLGRSWTDFVFRRVRRLMGLELLLTVLLTAELIGEVYYRAIRAATRCPTLRAICSQLLRDERMHVRFHVERFRFLRRRRWRIRTRIQDAAWRLFFSATSLVVWWKHGSAMRLGGYTLRRFREETMTGWHRAVRESCRHPSSSSR